MLFAVHRSWPVANTLVRLPQLHGPATLRGVAIFHQLYAASSVFFDLFIAPHGELPAGVWDYQTYPDGFNSIFRFVGTPRAFTVPSVSLYIPIGYAIGDEGLRLVLGVSNAGVGPQNIAFLFYVDSLVGPD